VKSLTHHLERFFLTAQPPVLRGAWASLDLSQRVFAAALGLSILLHAVLLSIHFRFPDAMQKVSSSQLLEVVLINSKSRSRPVKPDVQAQANLDGGGNTDDNRVAKTPLPVLRESDQGSDVLRAARRVQELEEQQRQLLAKMKQDSAPKTQTSPPAPRTQTEPQPPVSGADLATRALATIQREAQIARDIDEYNKRPRKLFVGVRASETSAAMYVDTWRQKIERIGSLNYPDEARGKIYDSLQLSVTINADGTIAGIEFDRRSNYPVINAAAERIVRMAGPYARLPAELTKDYDVLVITRTWHFTRGDRVVTQ
jgi:protein TonB